MIAQLFNDRRFDPYRELDDFRRRLFADFEPKLVRTHVAIDVRDEGDKFVLEADLPGFVADDVEIIAAPERLTLKGKRKAPDKKALHRERNDYAFERRFELPRGIDLEAVEAKLDNGVLTVTLPKRAADRPRTIAVRTAPEAPAAAAQ